MEENANEATADVAVDIDVKVVADADAADVDNAGATLPPPAAPSLSSLIALGKVQDGEVLRCVKVRWTMRKRGKKQERRGSIEIILSTPDDS